MSDNVSTSESEDENSENSDCAKDETEVIDSLTYVLSEVNRQQDYRRHQVDTSVQLSLQLIGFASLTSPFTALTSVHVHWLKHIALALLAIAVSVGLIDIFNPTRSEDELPLGKLRDAACVRSKKSILLYQIDNKIANEKKARTDENNRIRWIKFGYVLLGTAVLCTVFSAIDYSSIVSWIRHVP